MASIESFFNELKSSIEGAIEKAKTAQKLNITSLSDSYQSAVNSVLEASNILELQKILVEGGDNEEAMLMEFINKHCENS